VPCFARRVAGEAVPLRRAVAAPRRGHISVLLYARPALDWLREARQHRTETAGRARKEEPGWTSSVKGSRHERLPDGPLRSRERLRTDNNCIGIGERLLPGGPPGRVRRGAIVGGEARPLGFRRATRRPGRAAASVAGGRRGGLLEGFITATAPEFKKSPVEQLETFMVPTWQALIEERATAKPPSAASAPRWTGT